MRTEELEDWRTGGRGIEGPGYWRTEELEDWRTGGLEDRGTGGLVDNEYEGLEDRRTGGQGEWTPMEWTPNGSKIGRFNQQICRPHEKQN